MSSASRQAAPKVRLFVDHPLSPGGAITLEPAQAHYIGAVMRLKPGASVALFNGRDGLWRGEIADAGKGRATLKVEEQIQPFRPVPDLWLLFAPIKHGRIDFLVEKATELGVGRLRPVFTAHAQAERVNTARLRARAIEAAEQSERLDVPLIDEAVSLGVALDGWPAERLLLVCDEASAVPLGDVLAFQKAEGLKADRVALLIGPEGGLAPADRKVLGMVRAAVSVSLGPRILRAETAALAALACTMAVLGDRRAPR
ncbi:MAG: 16S rRNA (uracil(1498)-N(3))-methyltransferase [Alphaproteobacteria bacterium]|nr:16S rRNA (uracil(1498)-N(3))-methyltransferase [Alphaproteobacteria bacterium]